MVYDLVEKGILNKGLNKKAIEAKQSRNQRAWCEWWMEGKTWA